MSKKFEFSFVVVSLTIPIEPIFFKYQPNKGIFKSSFFKIKNTIQKNNRPLLIFPQGTRVKFNERIPFKKGVGRIYDSLDLPCIPVALNSGKIWPKNSFIKYPGDIHISFLEPIKPGLEKSIFIKVLEDKIYSETEKYS